MNGTGVNAKGQATGLSTTTALIGYHAYVYSGGTMKDLGTLAERIAVAPTSTPAGR